MLMLLGIYGLIFEGYNPGAIVKILGKGRDAHYHVLWEGDATPGPAPRWFEPALANPGIDTRTIRIVLDTNRVNGWNEIDAVELVDRRLQRAGLLEDHAAQSREDVDDRHQCILDDSGA